MSAKVQKKTMADHIARRIARCRAGLKSRGVPAYLITQAADVFYTTGFTGEDSAVIITPRTVHVVTDPRFAEACDDEIPWATTHMRKGSLQDEVAKVCRRINVDRVAYQPDGVTVAFLSSLRAAIKPFRLVKAPPIANHLRLCKDETELRVMGEAIGIAQEAFTATRRFVRVGRSEQEIAAKLEFEMRRRGASASAFETIVAVDGNASRPHARAGQRKVKRGSLILIDWGAKVGGYHSDLTRVLFVGRIPPRFGEVYELVLCAQQAAIDAIRPGERMCDIDAIARAMITKAGYGKMFGHGLGHGLGLNVHEPPALSWRSSQRLADGMVVTVEPGVYIPGVGGVRIEDDVLVTGDGHRVLSKLNKNLNRAIL